MGKTTTTVNLGAALAELDYRVLVIDLDPQGNATTGLGIDARNFELSMYDVIMQDQPLEDCIEPTSVQNLFVAPATIDLAGIEIELVPAFSRELKLKRAIDAVVDDFDFILIDCPPSLGLITVNGLAAAGEVIVPIQCEYYALEGLSQLLRNVNLVSVEPERVARGHHHRADHVRRPHPALRSTWPTRCASTSATGSAGTPFPARCASPRPRRSGNPSPCSIRRRAAPSPTASWPRR